MTKRSANAADGSIGQQAGSALDSVVQPMQSVVNSLRETVSSAVSGMAGFMKEPSDTMSRRTESAMRTVAEVVSPKPSRARAKRGTSRSGSASGRRAEATRAVQGVARKTRAAIKTTTRAATKLAKPTARKTTGRKPAAARARARRRH
jgi:hypothetical protein